MRTLDLAPHEFDANLHFAENGLDPWFGADVLVKDAGGSRSAEFTHAGEQWVARLSYRDEGGLLPPTGSVTDGGTHVEHDTIREFQFKIARHPDEDPVGKQDFIVHMSPRWGGLHAEKDSGEVVEIPVPPTLKNDGLNLRIQGSNIAFTRYLDLFQTAARVLGFNANYFQTPAATSNIQDAEKYARVHRDASGPVHGRDGPIASMAHLLEDDRSGYRKLVQNDDDEKGENLPGYYHTVTLDTQRLAEAFPGHRYPKEVKHYYAREAARLDTSEALAHPKVGASLQHSLLDRGETMYYDDLVELERELDQTVLSVLADAGLDVAPENIGRSPYVENDAYWEPSTSERGPDPIQLDLTRIRQEQESVVVRHLTDGLSPVQWEALDTLVTDGGEVSPQDIAEANERHVGSVRRALRSMEELVSRKYGEVGLRSDYVAEMIHDAVQDARDATRTAIETSAKAIEAAERGVSDAMAEWVAWCNRYGIDIRNRADALEVDMGEFDAVNYNHKGVPKIISSRIRSAFEVWTAAGQDPERFRQAIVKFRVDGIDHKRRAWKALR
ncbi:homolog to HGPV1-ORF14 [Halobacterium hubeiense]|uniref:Homolog to HGPV1-ORF14 n=1 Tax=Halobacterium hubeiense TaxID=1407499 RepID=A0A0U5HTJ3_9EURY|nr:MarR family transcriptional regulator [Halobacterium hubeiense]CQH55125.1 homolog to HGPV1-ORF14 [Halobacterium hubeiense]